MTTKQIDKADPRWVTVQAQTRMPWWRKQQLEAKAVSLGVNLPTLITDALDRVYPPEAPK